MVPKILKQDGEKGQLVWWELRGFSHQMRKKFASNAQVFARNAQVGWKNAEKLAKIQKNQQKFEEIGKNQQKWGLFEYFFSTPLRELFEMNNSQLLVFSV